MNRGHGQGGACRTLAVDCLFEEAHCPLCGSHSILGIAVRKVHAGSGQQGACHHPLVARLLEEPLSLAGNGQGLLRLVLLKVHKDEGVQGPCLALVVLELLGYLHGLLHRLHRPILLGVEEVEHGDPEQTCSVPPLVPQIPHDLHCFPACFQGGLMVPADEVRGHQDVQGRSLRPLGAVLLGPDDALLGLVDRLLTVAAISLNVDQHAYGLDLPPDVSDPATQRVGLVGKPPGLFRVLHVQLRCSQSVQHQDLRAVILQLLKCGQRLPCSLECIFRSLVRQMGASQGKQCLALTLLVSRILKHCHSSFGSLNGILGSVKHRVGTVHGEA
mmetsp:Transcript_28019/g.80391  ORF Transcript_28019/g.80391 Transcript_28019/m.80391 type:complete len:329 (-) Transcript_28019:598-1584(-)